MRKKLLAALVVVSAVVGGALAYQRLQPHTDAVEKLIIDQHLHRYGVTTPAALRARVLKPIEDTDAKDAEVLAALWDSPDEIRVWQHLREKAPTNLKVLCALQRAQVAMGDEDGALATVREALALHPAYEDIAKVSFGSPHEFEQQLCALTRKKGLHDESVSVCRESAEKGCLECRVSLARTLLEDGDAKGAIEALDAALLDDPKNSHAFYVRGLAHWALLETKQANADWASALQVGPENSPAQRMIEQSEHSLEAALKWERNWNAAPRGISHAWCGHYMNELDLPEQAKRCFEIAERFSPGSVDAQHLYHRGEYDVWGARADGEAMLEKNPPIVVVGALADLRMRTGDLARALNLFRRVVDDDPRNAWAHTEIREACRQLDDTRCVQHEYLIQIGQVGH